MKQEQLYLVLSHRWFKDQIGEENWLDSALKFIKQQIDVEFHYLVFEAMMKILIGK